MTKARQATALEQPWDGCVAHFAEIALKRGNRGRFLNRLRENLASVVRPFDGRVRNLHNRLLVTAPVPVSEWARQIAAVCGVAYAAPVRKLERTPEALDTAAIEYYRATAAPGASFAIRAKRSSPDFPLRASDIERRCGAAVVAATGAPVNLTQPDVLIELRVFDEAAYLTGPRMAGPGGLPTGVTGRALCLFSGGLDSPVAAWMMMRRGCKLEYIHFYMAQDVESLRDSKITRLIEKLIRPQGLSARLHLVPYMPFQLALLNSNIPPDLELIAFRRYLVRISDRIARIRRCEALVTGDNLGQVASQTMRNLGALEGLAERPVFRPLLALEKQEIIDRAKTLDLFDVSTEDYHDCCSLIARSPNTGVSRKVIERFETSMELDALTRKAVDQAVRWTLS